MYAAIDRHSPHQAIHLGDLMDDAEEVAQHYPKLPFCMVPGNCDGWTTAPVKKQIVLDGKSILLSHGHRWGVKSGYAAALADARAAGADILLFGHTHRAVCEQQEDGLWMMNPGAQPVQLRADPDRGRVHLLHTAPVLSFPPQKR